MRQSTKTAFIATRGFCAVLSCCAALVAPGPYLRVRDHPPPPQVSGVALAEAEPQAAGPPGPGLPAQGRDVRRARAGSGVGTTTAWRYVRETLALLAARAPKLRQAVRAAKTAGYAYAVLDGTLIPVDRVAADRPFYSGKHRRHGMNLQVIASSRGDILWVSGAGSGLLSPRRWTPRTSPHRQPECRPNIVRPERMPLT
jgi:DDE superfamily endonuclease